MCTGSQMKDFNKEGMASTNLLELAAADDLIGFKVAVEDENGIKIDDAGIWYGRKIGSKQMAFEERTPLMIASMFGSKHVAEYILQHDGIDVNRACGSDGATALHCAVSGGSNASYDVVKLLLDACADFNSVDANGNRPADLLSPVRSPSSNHRKKCDFEDSLGFNNEQNTDQTVYVHQVSTHNGIEKKEYPVDPTLPDIRNGVCGTDEFRMYVFKVKPCSRAYSHDWTECPFVHPGENARRRDPRQYHYSCVPCPEFRKGLCSRGDICEYAHGIFESWLHPAQYRTRLCKDETNCSRRVCFFAHKPDELRLLYAAASGSSAAPSPTRSFPTMCHSSSPVRPPPSYGNEASGKTASFANRSQSFIERGVVVNTPEDSPFYGSPLSDWSSPDGKLDWGMQKEDINKLRKSASFGLGKSGDNFIAMASANDDPDVSSKPSQVDCDQYKIDGVQSGTQTTSWADMLFSDQKQIAA